MESTAFGEILLTMSRDNVEIVRRHIEAWSAEDAALALSFLDPHIVLDLTRAGAIEGGLRP